MNEKLLELAKQCGYWSGQTIEMNDVGIEKFAELIVKKCAEVADNADATRQKWEGIGKYVKEHFGVEE